MKTDFINEQKKSFPFKKFDLIIYIIVSLLVVSLFLTVFLVKKDNKNYGFEVKLNNKTIITYVYGSNIYIDEAYYNFVKVEESENQLFITIYTDENRSEYNILNVDNNKKSVCMIDANCSATKDCTDFEPITNSNGTIICLPHALYIIPLEGGYVSPVVGG